MNITVHENNFSPVGTPWWPVFYEDKKKTKPLSPPFDLSAAEGVVAMRPADKSQARWDIWEGAVKYVAESPTRFAAHNLITLKAQYFSER